MVQLLAEQPEMEIGGSDHRGLALHKVALPRPGEHVIVQCQSFRCLGYCDSDGAWRNSRTSRELAGVKWWSAIGDDNVIPIF